ncbi:MAG TPA: tetrahydromethanopterin S-methyltransferase subunit G [Candidatus Bathyarchaeia archaeon]|nr:tetrahydromethanopterin S-methyltransferase subunit G [Candidatus Bathyarchaeia archaeon]
MPKQFPQVMVDQTDYRELQKKLDTIEERLEFAMAEVAQRYGQRVGRDIGIAYGLIGGIILFLVLNSLTQLSVLFRLFG